MEGSRGTECDRASETSSFIGDEEEEEEEEEDEEEEAVDPEEAEELTNSLKDLIQSEDVKPKLQYIMTNPSFSMVTCQSEDSGITWETSSSRCSTPWTSETSTASDLYSMESSPVGSPPGKVIFIMDEGKIIRKRTHKSSNRATRLKGVQCNKKRDSSGMQRQEPRTVLGDVQASMLNVEQVEAQDTDEEILDNKEDLENIAEEPIKRTPIRSIFRESRMRKVGPILGGPVQARIQLFNSIFGETGPTPETLEKNRIRRSSSASVDSEKFLETSVKERLQKFGSLSEVTHPKHFQGARSKILETPSERRRKQRQQLTEQANQSFSSPTPSLGKQLAKKNDVSSENIEPYKMKESTLQHEERKERQPLLETPNQVSGHSLKFEEDHRKQQSHSTMARTSITESTTSTSLKSDEKQMLLPLAENANKKPDQSLLTASDHLDEVKKQEVQPNSSPQSVSADFVSELDRPSSQHILPTESMSEYPERETEKSYLTDVPSAKSKYSTSTEIRHEDIFPQSSETAQSECERVLLPCSGDEREKQETECPSSTTALSESVTSGVMYSAEREEGQKTPSSETQNVNLENQTKSELDFSLQGTEKQGIKLKPPIPENTDSRYFGISYPVHTETEETQKTSFINKLVDFDHSDFSIEEHKQAEGGQMEMEYPDFSYSTEETEESETTQMETEHLDFSSPKDETEELKDEQMEMEHPDFSFSREEIEEPGSSQLETELPDFSYSKEETEGLESAIPDTDYPELLFSSKETEKSGRSQLETEHTEFFSKDETKEPESAQLKMGHPDFYFSREEKEESDSTQLKTEHSDLSYFGEEMVESESAQLEMGHPDSSLTKETVRELQSARLEKKHQVLLSREETENEVFSPFEREQSYSPEKEKQEEKVLALVHSDLPCLMEEAEKENTTELQLVHPDIYDSTGRAEVQQTGYLDTAFSDLPYPMNKTKEQELLQTDKGEQPQLVQQDSQSGGKLDSSAMAMQGQTTQLQSEHPVWPHSTRKEQEHKTLQMKVKQSETLSSTGKTEHQKLQPKLEQTDSLYSQGEILQEAVQRNLEGPEPSCFISEAEKHENVQVVSEKTDFSFMTGEAMQKGVESGTSQSQLTDRAKPWEMTQMEQEQSFLSCSTAGAQQQETPPLNVPQPDVSWSFRRMEQETVQREVKQQETDQQEAVQMETEYSGISESLGKEEPQVIDQISLAQQEISQPVLVHPSLPYSFSKQMQEEMQTEPAYPEKAFYLSTETEKEIIQHKSQQQEIVHPELEQTFLTSSSEKEAQLEMEITSEYPDLPYSSYEHEKLLKNPTLPFHFKQQETEPAIVEHPDLSYEGGESKQGDIVEQESGHPELSYSMGETQQKSEHLDSRGSLGNAAQDESMEVESQYPNQSCSQVDSKYSDSLFSFGKGEEQSTQKFESKHRELPKVARKKASPATAQIESKHPETAPWEMKHPDFSTGETSQKEVASLDQKHRKLSLGREKQPKAIKQQLEQGKLTQSHDKRDTSEHVQEALEQPNLSFSIDRPDDEMTPPEAVHTDVVSPLDNTEVQRRVQEREQTYPFRQVEQKTVQPEVEISHLPCSVDTAEETEMVEAGQGHSDLPYSVFKVGGLQTSQMKPEHPGLTHSFSKVQETIQLGLEEPDELYGHDKTEQLQLAQLEPGHASLAPLARELEQRGMAHTRVECSEEEQSVRRAEHPQAAEEKQGTPDAPSPSGKMEQSEMLKTKSKHPDSLHSIDKAKPQGTTQPMLEKPNMSSWPGTTEQGQTAGEEKTGFLHPFRKEAQGKKAQTELGHLELCRSLSEAEQESLNAKAHHSDLSAGRLEHHEIIHPEAEIMDLSCSTAETQQTQITDEDLECLDSFHSTGTVQQEKIQPEQAKTDEFSSSLSKAEEWKDAGMQGEHPEPQCSMEKTEGLQNSQANSEYADLTFFVGTTEPHKTTQPELKEQNLLHSFVKTKPSWAALSETEHANVMDAMGKVLHTDFFSSVSEEKRSAQLEVKQERGSYTLHPEEIVQLKLEQPAFSSPHGMEEQPNRSPVEGELPDFFSSGKTETQDAAQAGFIPSDISYSTGKSEQLQPEQLNSKHPDLSHSLGKAETHVIKSLGLSYSYGKAKQPQTAQREHPEIPYFTGETKQRDDVQAEQPCVSLQSSDVETEQPETRVAHTSVRFKEQRTAQPDFKQSDLLSPTDEAEKHEMAPLRAGHSQKQDTGAPSSLGAQLEIEQQNVSFSTKEADNHKTQPYSSLTKQTVSASLGASHTASETSPEGGPKSSPITGGSPPRHLDISYSHGKTEYSETALPEPGSFFARKEEENIKSLLCLPIAAKSEAECEILPEAEREPTPHYFDTAAQLESEQLNLSYSTDKTETLESQDYLTVPSKLQSKPSVPFYLADEMNQQEVHPYSKPVSEYLVPTQSLAEQENQSMQPLITQPIQSECEHVIPLHNEKQLQKIQFSSPEIANLRTVPLESMYRVQDQEKPESCLLDTIYLSPDQLRSSPKFTTEQYEQEIQPDVKMVPRSVNTESKLTGVADQQAVSSESFIPFHKLAVRPEFEKSVSVDLTDDEEKQTIQSSLSDVADMLGKKSNKVSGIYTEGEHRCEMQQCFEDQKHTSLEHLGVVSSDLVHETLTHKTQYYSGEWGSLSSVEIKQLISSSEENQNPDIPPFGLASWQVEEVKAHSIIPMGSADVDMQGIQITPSEASDFGLKQFPGGSCTEFTVHGTTETKGHTFRVSESVSNKVPHRKSSDTSPRTQRYDLSSLVGDNQGPDKFLEHEASTLNPTRIEAMQHLEADKMSEMPEDYLRGEEEEMEHASDVEDNQHALETTEQKDLFNIISEGYEILNIHAPTHISSVDQEESKHMPDKLEYLETNPLFRRKLVEDGQRALTSRRTTEISESSMLGKTASHELIELVKKVDVDETEETQQENLLLPENNNYAKLDPNNGTADMDYFEKYTLIDDKSPVKPQFEGRISLSPVTEDPNESMEEAKSFKESIEVDTLEEFSLLEDLDEVFYGTIKGESKMQSYADISKPLPLQKSIDSSSKSITNVEDEWKSPGTPLFNSKEGVLERSLLFPTTVAAVNPELLEEPPALSFLYKDLYAEAVGEKRKDDTPSDEESGNSNASFPSRNSDTDDGTGMYFEKYILKDEVTSKAIGPQKDQIPEDESFSGGILVLSSENKQKQGSGDVQYVKPEVLSERGLMERDKFQVDSIIQATICKPMHAIPFGSKTVLSGAGADITEQREEEIVLVERADELPEQSSQQGYSHQVVYQGAAYQEASTKQEEQQDITAVPQMEKYIPCVRVPTEDSVDDQLTQEHLSCVPTIQQTEYPDLQREEQHRDVYEDFAESMDYDVITQEELLQDEISSQLTHEELLFEDRDSFDHAADSYEFVNEPEQRTPVELEDSGFVVMYPEKSATNIPQVESPKKELKKAQVDTYCYCCKCPISAIDKLFGEHKDHEVTTLDDAATKMKDQLSKLLTALEEKSMKIEGFVSDIELRFNSVEENCNKSADLLEKQNEEMLKKVVAQYDEKSENFEEVKKMKMEYLYEQMVNFRQTVDSAKETLETTVKETEEVDGFVFLNSSKELNKRLLSAMDTTLSLEKVPSAFSLFEHYADSPGQSHQHSLQHMAVPQTPTVIPQEPNSATSTSIAVYWAVNDGDTIDCFQVYCMEELQASKDAEALVEEYRVTVKESHCILDDLEPDHCYSVWVMAVNATGCSLPSEKNIFKTAPAVPTIKAEDCTVCWDTATVRWRATSLSAESFVLEYCRQHSPEGEGLRSFTGIKKPELKVSLEPNVNYFFYLRAVNPFGISEQSEAALISTKGTRFHLLTDTAHPALKISSNPTVIHLPEKPKLTGFPSVLGELLPAQGCHYWEIVVSACRSYRIGICYEANTEKTQSSILGLNDTSWCMRCCPTQTSFLYRFLHTGVMSDVHVTEHLARIGILLDYSSGRLLFFNAERGLVLFAIRHKFTDAAHPAFALEKAGVLTLCTGMELPEFVKQS